MIFVRILFLCFVPFILYAKVNIVAPDSFIQGESVTFSINASGSDVDFPIIKDIDGFAVEKIGTQSSIRIVNGQRTQKLIANYLFYPTKELIIPSFKIKINGKIEKTKSKKLTIKKINKTKSNNFDLDIKLNKKEVFVGEEILLTMTFKYKKNIQLYDLQFSQPNFNNFWSKQIQTNEKPQDNLYIIQKLHFLLFPQKSGILNIKPFKIIAVIPDINNQNNFFRSATKNKKIYSNNLKVKVNPLPDDTYLIGNFKINTKVDKQNIKVGEAVSFQLEISGRGNIDDLEEYTLDIPNATIYDNPSKKDFNIKNGKYGGIYKKSYSIVANDDFIIPSIKLKYFDKKTNKVKIIKSNPYNIKLENKIIKKHNLEVKKNKVQNIIQQKTITKIIKTSDNQKIIFFVLGFISACIIFLVYILFKNKKINQKEKPLINLIKQSKSNNELFKIIIPYINLDKDLDKIIYNLEQNTIDNLRKTKKEAIAIINQFLIK